MSRQFALLIALIAACSAPSSPMYSQSLLDTFAIEVRGHSREFAYTNKVSAFYYGETSSENRSSWQGFNVFGHEFVDDYALIIDTTPLDRRSAVKVVVFPDYLKRIYPGGITEELRVCDSLAGFTVVIRSPHPIELGILPLFADGRSLSDFQTARKQEIALIARTKHLVRTERENYPVWLAVTGHGFAPLPGQGRHGKSFAPVILHSVTRSRVHTIAFTVSDDSASAERSAQELISRCERIAATRRARMERLLRESDVRTQDKRFNKALAWARISLDALIMNQGAKGIFAGLPWFNSYWGRDTFISLPGATLVTGRFGDAKEILRSFAEFQQIDSTSTDYGRIPNLVTTTDRVYNTADGTPRFIMMARAYVERSGDSSFINEIYPTIIRSIEGTLKYHTDSLGFLTHGDAETWMDAVGPEGPWSPRGNRANDVQSLWMEQLAAGEWFAARVGDVVSAQRWHQAREMTRGNFAKHFVFKGLITDHLKRDGSSDEKLRPNQIFVSPLLNDSMRLSVVRTVTNGLTYPYGVASLSQDDPDFHPFHQYPPYYPKDAAYHNGTVWTWLQGPLISELCRFGGQETAFVLTANSVHQILDRGAVGTQSELLDAISRPGEPEPRLSGTFSQAWNLAEFIRNFYDDYLGVQANLYERKLKLCPHIPVSVGKTSAVLHLGKEELDIRIDPTPSSSGSDMTISLRPLLNRSLQVEIELPTRNETIAHATFRITSGDERIIKLKEGVLSYYVSGKKTKFDSTETKPWYQPDLIHDLRFLKPRIDEGLKALKGPGYPLLSLRQIKASIRTPAVLVDVADSVGDDTGRDSYTYPLNSAFVPGSFDVTHFRVEYGDATASFYLKFRALSDPGWHPEYGFQLTFVAIALDRDGKAGSGANQVPLNANYVLPSDHGFERLILIGGGVEVQDDKGKVLVAYVPTEDDSSNPIGNAEDGTVRFSLPLAYLGTPAPSWTFTVLVGAQDDHGGAGLGEFRSVNREAGEWNGGGKMSPDDTNVYDVLVAPAR